MTIKQDVDNIRIELNTLKILVVQLQNDNFSFISVIQMAIKDLGKDIEKLKRCVVDAELAPDNSCKKEQLEMKQ